MNASSSLKPLGEAVAIASLKGLMADFDEERKTLLETLRAVTTAGEFGSIPSIVEDLSRIRELRTNISMAFTAYQSGVRSAVVLVCFVRAYLTLSPDDRPAARLELSNIFSSFCSEVAASSERNVAELAAAKTKAEEEAKRSQLKTEDREDRARADKAERQMKLRQAAFDKSCVLWRAFHTIYDIKDDDIRKLLSGMSRTDIDALLAKG